VRKILDIKPRIGVITIALNEEEFIQASLRAVIRHPNVKRVAVVEGAVNLFAHASTEKGLSLDNTKKKVFEVIQEENGDKIVYKRHGWASDKSELRNIGLAMIGNEVDYILVVDADEVWKQEDLDKLVKAMEENPRIGVFLFKFYHFWKKKNQITTGSMWDSSLFRCFKFDDKSYHWDRHELPVVNSGGRFIHKVLGSIMLPDVHVYHYGAMKSEKRILEKLEYYKKRDKNLEVKNTWSDWKKGQETQWTHGGGIVKKFIGKHPEEIDKIL
jgi:glycosyltransferase involved in cell wall biosynthesis